MTQRALDLFGNDALPGDTEALIGRFREARLEGMVRWLLLFPPRSRSSVPWQGMPRHISGLGLRSCLGNRTGPLN